MTFACLLTALLSFSASATPLSDPGYLRKLSYHLRGIKPSAADYAELAQAGGDTGAFFARKIREYQASPQAAERMAFRLSERFQVQTPVISSDTLAQNPDLVAMVEPVDRQRDALTDLFTRLVRENLPWATLINGKSYNAYRSFRDAEIVSDFKFLGILKPGLPDDQDDATGTEAFPVAFEAHDPRVAGALTTARFMNRYTTTNVNKNRRRAAAVFRIFLCDPMFPVIPPPPDRKGAALAQAFSDKVHGGRVTEKQLMDSFTVTAEQRHGSDKRCVACHYKLDPMGKTFQGIGVALGPEATPGKLRYAGLNGRAVEEYLRGIGDLGEKLAKQPEYVRCQVNWFWKQFIGADVPLAPERLDDLSARFEAVGQRTNDFINVLVTAPEFRERPTADDRLTFARVSPYLQRCDSCHAATNNLPMFSAGSIPSEILTKMRFRINLPEDDARKMPLDWASWDPKELDMVKRWINQAGDVK